MAKKIGVIVEGDGEVTAVPVLLYKILHHQNCFDVFISNPKNAHGCGNLTKPGGLERFVQYAMLERECCGVLVLLDGDTLGNCAVESAKELSERIKCLAPRVPVSIVIANREYEGWILASIESICGNPIDSEIVFPVDVLAPIDPDSINSAKGWIAARLPKNKTYKETVHQASMSRLIDVNLANGRSRSFRRLQNAVSQLLNGIAAETSEVTP